MTEKKHVDEYDWVRVIATILVVIGHSSYLAITTDWGGVSYELPSTLNGHYDDMICSTIREIGGWAYQFHMPLFFVLSGAVTAISNLESFDAMFEKKLMRLLIPYYVYGLLFMLPIKYWAGFYTSDTIKHAARSFLGISECGHLWFLPSLFWCFVFSHVLFKTIGKKSLYLVFVLVFLVWKGTGELAGGYYGVILAIRYITWFVVGYIFEKKRQNRKEDITTKRAIVRVAILSVAVWATSGNLARSDDFISVLVKIYWIYCISELCDRLAGSKDKISSAIRWLSKYCIYIYIFHDPLEYVILKYAFYFDWLSNGYGVYLYFFLRTVGVFAVSLFMGVIITKIKQCYTINRK